MLGKRRGYGVIRTIGCVLLGCDDGEDESKTFHLPDLVFSAALWLDRALDRSTKTYVSVSDLETAVPHHLKVMETGIPQIRSRYPGDVAALAEYMKPHVGNSLASWSS